MRAVVSSFEAVAGLHSATAYSTLASNTISRHFRTLRDAIVSQIQAINKDMGEDSMALRTMNGETTRLKLLDQCLRQQMPFQQYSGLVESHPWRSTRGLPEHSVTTLRAWLLEHFLHPYPNGVDKHMLARQTGLSRSQVSNWFINARVRLWKPMVEEMYLEETKEVQDNQSIKNPNPNNINQNPPREFSSKFSKCSAPHNPSDLAMSSASERDTPALPPAAAMSNGNVVSAPVVARIRQSYGDRKLRINPNKDHKPEKYDDLKLGFDPSIFSSLEKHLPPSLLETGRDAKIQFMKEILGRYLPEGERARTQRHKEYRQRIISAYQPLHKELYHMHAVTFFDPSFIKAIGGNTEESFRNIMSEPFPGIYTFAMLRPSFCELLLSEVQNFEKWVNAAKFKTMKPNTMNKYGAVLDDFGMEAMLNKFMEEFICPISRVFFPEVGGSTLDSHHGFVVEYGNDKDVELGFHVDDSEVTLNVCLGKEFSGGELFFRGTRCDDHVNSDTQPEEIIVYCHIPGQGVLHRGRHRHGARPTTSGHRINLLLWCRSSVFRETKRYQKDFSGWCGECQRKKKERQMHSKLAFLKREGGSVT